MCQPPFFFNFWIFHLILIFFILFSIFFYFYECASCKSRVCRKLCQPPFSKSAIWSDRTINFSNHNKNLCQWLCSYISAELVVDPIGSVQCTSINWSSVWPFVWGKPRCSRNCKKQELLYNFSPTNIRSKGGASSCQIETNGVCD